MRLYRQQSRVRVSPQLLLQIPVTRVPRGCKWLILLHLLHGPADAGCSTCSKGYFPTLESHDYCTIRCTMIADYADFRVGNPTTGVVSEEDNSWPLTQFPLGNRCSIHLSYRAVAAQVYASSLILLCSLRQTCSAARRIALLLDAARSRDTGRAQKIHQHGKHCAIEAHARAAIGLRTGKHV